MEAVREIIELNTKLMRMHAGGVRAVDCGELIGLLNSWIQRHRVPPPRLETERLLEALLAFIAQVSAGQPEAVKPMALPLLFFTIGVLLAVTCAAGTYLGSLMVASQKTWLNKVAVWMNATIIGVGLGSLGVFLVGAVTCYRIFSGY